MQLGSARVRPRPVGSQPRPQLLELAPSKVADFTPFDGQADGLQLDALERQLLRLRQPQQHFSFTTHTLSMADEPRLAMAFATSLRHTAHPSLGPDGAMHTEHRSFLDSAALQLALRDAAPRDAERPYRGPQTSRTLPIFVFSTDAALPLLIDRQFQARPLHHRDITVTSP